MPKPDSEFTYRPNPDLLTPINGDFAGKNILDISQLEDERSIRKLFLYTTRMERDFKNRIQHPQFAYMLAFSALHQTSTANKAAFEAAVLRLGAHESIQLTRPLNEAGTEEFETEIAKIGGIGTEVIMFSHTDRSAVFEAAQILKDGKINTPVINADEIERATETYPVWTRFQRQTNGIPLRMALIALTTGLV